MTWKTYYKPYPLCATAMNFIKFKVDEGLKSGQAIEQIQAEIDKSFTFGEDYE